MTRPTADSLVKALATGTPEAFAALYDRLGRSMLRVAGVMLRDASEAEDAVQDVFVQVAQRAEQLRHVENLDAYVFAMLRNLVKHRLHARQRERQRLRERPARVIQAAGPFQEDLDDALASLPDEQREVISLKVDGGLTFAEIAEVLGINANTAASRYRYALEKLRSALE